MSRTTLIVIALAAIVGIALAGGISLISNDDDAAQKPQAGRSPTSGAPEAEDHSVGELPAAEAAARRFLAGYLPLIYGKRGATADDLRSASPRLIAAIRSEGGHVTPAQSQRTPRLQRVTVIKDSAGVLGTAQIKDSPSPAYPLVLHLQDTPDGWVVTRIGGP